MSDEPQNPVDLSALGSFDFTPDWAKGEKKVTVDARGGGRPFDAKPADRKPADRGKPFERKPFERRGDRGPGPRRQDGDRRQIGRAHV